MRCSWDFDSQAVEPNLLSTDGLESVKSFDASQYSDGHSFSSEENYFQLPDLEKSLPIIRNSSPGLSVSSLDSVRNDLDQKTVEEQHDENLGDHCKEVICIESEDLITDTYPDSNPADVSQDIDTDSNASSPGANTAVSGLTEADNIDKENLDLCSSGIKENNEMNRSPQGSVLPSPKELCPWLVEKSASNSKPWKFTRSRSCKASLMKDSSSDWFDQEEIIQNTHPIGIEKDYIGIPEGFQRRTCTLNYNANAERLSWTGGYGNAMGNTSVDLDIIKSYTDKESYDDSDLSPARKSKKDLGSSNLPADHEVCIYCS